MSIFFVCLSVNGASWYASPTGTDSGAGTLADPLSIAKAFGDGLSSPIVAGDTVYLRGGAYTATVNCFLRGSSSNQINVHPYQEEQPLFRATNWATQAFHVYAEWVNFYGIEISNTDTNRTDDPRGTGVFLESHWSGGCKFVGLVIHDTGSGFYCHESGSPYEISDCLIYNVGNLSNFEHGIYTHSGPLGAILRDNLVFNGTGFGIHCYTESLYPDGSSTEQNIQIIGNTVANSDALQVGSWRSQYLLGGTTFSDNITALWNMGYHYSSGLEDGMTIGYCDPGPGCYENGSATILSNYFGNCGATINHWTNLTFGHNTFLKIPIGNPPYSGAFNYNPSPYKESYIWDTNIMQSASSNIFVISSDVKTWTQWKDVTGFDVNSTFITVAPTNTQIFVRPSIHTTGRANITIFNWSQLDNVSVDLSSMMSIGATYTVKNAAHYFGPTVASGIYSGGTISLPMTNLTVAAPVGLSTPSATGPEFNAFVLLSTNLSTGALLRGALLHGVGTQ